MLKFGIMEGLVSLFKVTEYISKASTCTEADTATVLLQALSQ